MAPSAIEEISRARLTAKLPTFLNPKFSDVEPKYEISLGAAYLEPDQIYSVGACRDFVG